MRMISMLGMLMLATPVAAQGVPERTPAIEVVGTATVETMPDRATLSYTVTGEGKTADAAATALAARQKSVAEGLAALLGGDTRLTAGNVRLSEVRTPRCDPEGDDRPRLSEGACAVVGYLATLRGSVRTDAVAKAGTATGLAARLGASNAQIDGFELHDRAAAQRRATVAAIANARAKAETIATGAGVRLGQVLTLIDQNAQNGGDDIVVTGSLARVPGVGIQPVAIDIAPRPVTTGGRVFARYAIAQ